MKSICGYKVYAISVNNIQCLNCEYWEFTEKDTPPRFQVSVIQGTASIKTWIGGHSMTWSKIQFKQFGVNNNVATTGHKL